VNSRIDFGEVESLEVRFLHLGGESISRITCSRRPVSTRHCQTLCAEISVGWPTGPLVGLIFRRPGLPSTIDSGSVDLGHAAQIGFEGPRSDHVHPGLLTLKQRKILA